MSLLLVPLNITIEDNWRHLSRFKPLLDKMPQNFGKIKTDCVFQVADVLWLS